MSRIKKLLKFLSNPWLYILPYFIVSLIVIGWLITKPVIKSLVLKEQVVKTKINKKTSRKINENIYFSTSYSINTDDKERTVTTAGIICILPNGNILHVIMTGENVNGRMKKTEETIGFLNRHQDEIFDDLARIIVEAGQKLPPTEPEKEKPLQGESDAPIKKKV